MGEMTMKVVSIINYKGGVGKTSLTANVAAELAWRGKRVLMVDMDAQASLTFSFVSPDAWEKNFAESKTIKSWFQSYDTGHPIRLDSLIHRPERVQNLIKKGKLDIIFSHLGLINVDLELATKLGGASLSQAKRNFITVHRRLADGLALINKSTYDVVLIDCPPNFNIVTKTAIIASDYILVPARPDYLSTLGIDYLIRSVNGLVKDYNDFANVDPTDNTEKISPKMLGVIFTMIQEYAGKPISTQAQFIERVRRMPNIKTYPNYIKRNDTVFADAPQYGIPVVLHGYSSGSHQSVVEGLESFVTEFCGSLRL
jgi:chromosome partitioning protein